MSKFFDFSVDQALVALRVCGKTQKDIADDFSVTPQAVYYAIRNPGQSSRIAAHIYDLIVLANETLNLDNLRQAS
jgi:hypothetical protein